MRQATACSWCQIGSASEVDRQVHSYSPTYVPTVVPGPVHVLGRQRQIDRGWWPGGRGGRPVGRGTSPAAEGANGDSRGRAELA